MEEASNINSKVEELIDLPPGFRFHPTDEEIITYYLTEKVVKSSFDACAIGEVDLNKCEPWDLPKKAKMGEKEWYFFCNRDRKYPTGMRTNRATEAGYWKATGKDKEIFKGKNCLVGMKKTLVFYRGRAPKGEKTNWVMHEYRLEGKFSYYNLPAKASKEEWVVCRVFHKSTGMKKNPNSEFVRIEDDFFDYSTLPPLMDTPPSNYSNRPSSSFSAADDDGDNQFDFKHINNNYQPTNINNNNNNFLVQPTSNFQPQIPPFSGGYQTRGLNNNPAGYLHQQLQNLYNSTRAAKHFQRNIVRGIEGYISVSLKQMEIVTKLAEDCCKHGTENQSFDTHVTRAALNFGTSHILMENERETLLGILGDQVSGPLRALITGAPLEDARHLTHRYEKLRQEVESQAAEVLKRRSKIRDSEISAESAIKLRSAEKRLTELKSTVSALGREATAAMLSVETQQQQITSQRLFAMVDAERTYHRHVISILEKLHAEMILEERSDESSSQSMSLEMDVNLPPAHQNADSDDSNVHMDFNKDDEYFIGKVIHPFDAQADGELSLSIDDFVVVRQVAPTGWSEGENKGKAGWFPSAYVERQINAPANKIMEANSSP